MSAKDIEQAMYDSQNTSEWAQAARSGSVVTFYAEMFHKLLTTPASKQAEIEARAKRLWAYLDKKQNPQLDTPVTDLDWWWSRAGEQARNICLDIAKFGEDRVRD